MFEQELVITTRRERAECLRKRQIAGSEVFAEE